MDETFETRTAPGRVGRTLVTLTRVWALAGGLVLLAMALLTVVSVVLRALGGVGIGPGAVPGDFELVEMGCAVAVFAFLPWCQIERGHVTVDILATRLGTKVARALRVAGDAALALAAIVVAARLAVGFGEKVPFGSEAVRSTLGWGPKPFFPETTYDLQIPVWIPFGLALIGAALFAAASLWTLWRAATGADRR